MAADSVAVNQPNTSPPMMITGVISAGTADAIPVNTSRSDARGYFG